MNAQKSGQGGNNKQLLRQVFNCSDYVCQTLACRSEGMRR